MINNKLQFIFELKKINKSATKKKVKIAEKQRFLTLSDMNICHLDVGQVTGIAANTVNIGSRRRNPPKKRL